MIDVIRADWEDFHYCEFCLNPSQKKTYSPLAKNVANPYHICEECIENPPEGLKFKVIDWMDSEKEYWLKLREIQD